MSGPAPFALVELPGVAVAVEGETTDSCLVIRSPTEAEIDEMCRASNAGDLAGVAQFYGLAGISIEQASALSPLAADELVAAITRTIAAVLHPRANAALDYDPES
ncbi:hypothetical protein AB6806_10920 [Bosea sp. RCC_152_1]|uniref:hypothetical protein n=1 Tax=Bosea sp. RCC_152_1 TaxID=3239228 RepID=UPI0035256C2C